MSNLERLIQEVQALPYLERQKLIEALQVDLLPDEQTARLEMIRKVRGSMKGILPSTAEFLAEKHAELEREEQ
jgi:hypothetical protein